MNKNRYILNSKNNCNTEVLDYINIENSDLILELLFTEYWKEHEWSLINKLDAFNLKWLSEEAIEELVNKLLQRNSKEETTNDWSFCYKTITLDDEEAIDILNNLFRKALKFYEEELKWYLQKSAKRKVNIFNSKEDVIAFLAKTKEGVKTSQFNCTIAKIAYSINEILDTPELLKLDKKTQFFLKEYIWPWLMIDDYDLFSHFWSTTWKIVISNKIIDFKIRSRPKNGNSSSMKILKDEAYLKGKDIKDQIWVELEVETPEDTVLLLSHFYYKVFHRTNSDWDIVSTLNELKNKKIITKELVEEMEEKGLLEKDFLAILKNLNYTPKPMQNEDYWDAKIVWNVMLPINIDDSQSQKIAHWVEFRCILVWNTNEEGLSDHRVLDTWKIILTWIRLKWYISEPFIKHLVNILLEENKDLDEKYSNDEILHYYTAKLEKTVRKKWAMNIYTSKKRNMLKIHKDIEESENT